MRSKKRGGVIPIVALDVSTSREALRLVDRIGDTCRFFKVGSELFTAAGPQIVEALRAAGCDVFLDLKFHDIPNTVAGAVRSACKLGARILTIHASGGQKMLRAAVDATDKRCELFGVTVLTSLDAAGLGRAWGRKRISLMAEVVRLADEAKEAGLAGIVCSGHEANEVSRIYGEKLKLLIPGIRLEGDPAGDQARHVTPREAASAGANYIVLGRSITRANDPKAAMKRVAQSLETKGK